MTRPVRRLRVGTRESALAMIQTKFVVDKLRALYPENEFVIVGMTTKGDQILDTSLSKIGGKSLFTSELEAALSEEKVDFLVHSLKDVPTTLPKGLCIGAIIEREDPSDAVVFPEGSTLTSLDQLEQGAKVGTSSLRRVAQLRRCYKHLEFVSIRGNLNTRLQKLDKREKYDALVLAASGLYRLNMSDRISHILPPDLCLHAVGQGALAVECRSDDAVIQDLIRPLNHRATALRCLAERCFMNRLEGGCSVPLGVSSAMNDSGVLTLKGGVFAFDGGDAIIEEHEVTLIPAAQRGQGEPHMGILCFDLAAADVDEALRLGSKLATTLIKHGAKELLDKAREDAKLSSF
ncbi:porphobilinogen deaminase-like [Tropilaelaps mercedesae]|uniref:hydroxymethylbilane synthase n=1 Tax=Tropilaelaps mercedesae TaxID=418985 RepID=A0A1V9XNH8_9ACAR|nr:porphobilinogen deaminase-like [Tropilaelaps mercedesae]